MAAFAIVAVSCEKDDSVLMGRPSNPGAAEESNPGDSRRAANSVVPKTGKRTITTLLGATFTVSPDLVITTLLGATYTVSPDLVITAIGNTANIVPELANISASNGIIHVIDAVILPIE